jgi:hypothetical protein
MSLFDTLPMGEYQDAVNFAAYNKGGKRSTGRGYYAGVRAKNVPRFAGCDAKCEHGVFKDKHSDEHKVRGAHRDNYLTHE